MKDTQPADPLLVKIKWMKRLCAESYAALPERFRGRPLDFELNPDGPPRLLIVGSPEFESLQSQGASPIDEPEPLCKVFQFDRGRRLPNRD